MNILVNGMTWERCKWVFSPLPFSWFVSVSLITLAFMSTGLWDSCSQLDILTNFPCGQMLQSFPVSEVVNWYMFMEGWGYGVTPLIRGYKTWNDTMADHMRLRWSFWVKPFSLSLDVHHCKIKPVSWLIISQSPTNLMVLENDHHYSFRSNHFVSLSLPIFITAHTCPPLPRTHKKNWIWL